MPLESGTSIGPYQILAPIGAGGMGEVYRARDTKLKRDVALKVLPDAVAADPERLARFAREAEVLAALNHPNIATIYGVEGRALVMELVGGASPHGPMSFADAWRVAAQIADALEYAHDKGIVHRDLKPANVMVSDEGVVKLLDFGLAKAFTEPAVPNGNPEHSPTLTIGATQVGVILGTAGYMSPEQAKGKSVDQRADIWAFGVMFYELLTGHRLFHGEDVSDTLAQVLTKEPDLSQVPAPAQRLLRRCLEKDPKKRLRDIREVRYYIDEPAASPAAAPRSKTPWLPWAIAGAALLLAPAAYWLRPAPRAPRTHSFLLPPGQAAFRCQGDDAGPAVLSPDGKRMAFTAAAADGKVMVWVRPLDSASQLALPGTEGAVSPFWSPDSGSIGFFAGGKLKKVDVGGGPVSVVADAPAPRGGSWSQDGVILFPSSFTSGLVRVSASGGAVTPVTHLDDKLQEMSHRWPWFLPDGKHFLYTSRDRGVFVGSLDGAQPRRLLEENTNAVYVRGHLLYTRANTLLARPFDAERATFTGDDKVLAQSIVAELNSNRACFTASDTGLLAFHAGVPESQLTWFDTVGSRPVPAGTPALFDGVEIAPDGSRVAVVVGDGAGGDSLWVYDLARGVKTRLSSANTAYAGLIWSPDGRRVAVSLQKDGVYGVYAKDASGSGGEELLFRSRFEVLPVSWLPNGGLILNTRNPKTGWDVEYLPPAEKSRDRVPVTVVRTEFDDMGGAVSPDMRWIAYSTDGSGAGPELFVAAFPDGGNGRKISSIEADLIRWSKDGKEIVWGSRNKLMAVPVRTVGNSFDVGTPHLKFEFHADCAIVEVSCFDVTPDGKRFLVLEPTGSAPPVALVQNWDLGLKK